MKNKYVLKILFENRYEAKMIEADEMDASSGGYYYFMKKEEKQRTIIAYYPIGRTIIETIEPIS
jgi:hypothetical protein